MKTFINTYIYIIPYSTEVPNWSIANKMPLVLSVAVIFNKYTCKVIIG